MRRAIVRVDMTPMVDLGFILISFFVMTVSLGEPVAVNLYMPKESKDSMQLGKSDALTVLLDENDRMWYYHGEWREAVAKNEVYETSYVYTGLGNLIREKQKWLGAHNHKEGRNGLMLLVKPGRSASYKNIVDALDEIVINDVKKYALLAANEEEINWMNSH